MCNNFYGRYRFVLSVFILVSALITQPVFAQSSSKAAPTPQNLEVDPMSGTASTQIPIAVAEGRRGIQPNLSLVYNSASPNDILGVGWILELGRIERSAKRGLPQYNNSDIFNLIQAGSRQELVDRYNDATEFMPLLEGSFMKIKFSGTSWTVMDKKGIKYSFGTAAESRVSDPADATKVFSWALDRVEDLNGNYMTITYTRDGNQLYPFEIKYTGNTPNSILPYASVKFTYEARPDTVLNNTAGFPMKIMQRLSTIDVLANSNLLRKYKITYTQSAWLNRSLVFRVNQYGSDGTSSLPATHFNYSTEDLVSYQTASVNFNNFPDINIGNARAVSFMDMNRDGLPDIVRTTPGGGNYQIYFNRSQGSIVNFDPPVAAANSPTRGMDNPSFQFVDFNGDGLLDVIDGTTTTYKIWVNNGINGYNAPVNLAFNAPTATLDSGLVVFTDMDGDGLADVLQTTGGAYKFLSNNGNLGLSAPVTVLNPPSVGANSPEIKFADFNGDGLLDVVHDQSGSYKIYINNRKDGFKAPTTVVNGPGLAFSSNRVQFVDLNGDGLADILKSESGQRPAYHIYYNNGRGDFDPAMLSANPAEFGLDNANVKLADMNADGLVDLYWGTTNNWNAYLNNGSTGFFYGVNTNVDVAFALDDPNLVLADINGDGQLDMVYGSGTYKAFIHTIDAKAPRSNVLTKIDNSMGGLTEIAYTGSPISYLLGFQYKSAFNSVIFNTVQSMTRRDLFSGESYTANYIYKDCAWNHNEREFMGFRYAKVIDPDGNYSETTFLQEDVYRKGQVIEQASYNAQGELFSKVVNSYGMQDITYETRRQVKFGFLLFTDRFVYDGNSTGRRTREEYFYDEPTQSGNLTKTIQRGEVDVATGNDIGTDSRTLDTTYNNNTNASAWLIGLPKLVTVKDHAGNFVRKTWFYYDNATLDVAPTKGLLSKKEDWAGDQAGAVKPTTLYAYNSFGNLTSTTDPKNNQTTIAYDTATNLFPLATTNALGHQVINEYYGVNGVALNAGGYTGLWGQLKSTTDPNAQTGKRIYDVFGREVAGVSPVDSVAFPTASTEYSFESNYFVVTKRSRIVSGQPATIDTAQFFDGFGRLIHSKSRAEAANTFVVSGQTQYNSRGLPIKKYLPFFSTAPFYVMVPIDTAKPFVRVDYDAMGRAIKTTNTDGSYSNVVSDDWTATAYSENGHMQKSYMDAYGRLVKKEEYLGADGRNANYPAAAYTLYATTQYTYDSEGNLTQTTDAKGNIATITYDKLGRKISMIDPDMGTWQYTYDLNGNLFTQKDAKNQTITFTYDKLNRLTNKTDGASLNVNYTFDDVTKPYSKGRLTQAGYNGQDKTQFGYDLLGRELTSTKTIDLLNFNVQRSYDDLNRLVSLKYPDQSAVAYTYNTAGAIESVTDLPLLTEPASNTPGAPGIGGTTQTDFTTFTTSNPAGTLAVAADCITYTSLQTRNTNAYVFKDLTSIGDLYHTFDTRAVSSDSWAGVMAVWGISDTPADTFEDWNNGVMIGFYRSGSSTIQLKVGQILNRVVSYPSTSVALNMNTRYYLTVQKTGSSLTTKIYSDAQRTVLVNTLTTNLTIPATMRYVYGFSAQTAAVSALKLTGDSCRLAMTNKPQAPVMGAPALGNSFVRLNWNQVSNAVGYKIRYGTTAGSYTTTKDVGNLTSYTVVNLANNLKQYFVVSAYNQAGESINSNEVNATPKPVVYVKNIDYNHSGQMTKIEYGNNAISTYTYDPQTLRLTRLLTNDGAGAKIQDLNYVYDGVGNIININDASHTDTQSFKYDALSRLTQAIGINYGTKTYAYDEIGNITQKEGISYTYSKVNAGPHAVTSLSDGTTFTYDTNGNMTSKVKSPDTTAYIYDTENRLIEVKKNGTTIAQYQYDGDGGRTKKISFVPAAGATSETCFLAGTPINMANGSTKAIDKLNVGDMVLSYDPKTMRKLPGKVKRIFAHETTDEYVEINGSLRATPNHPFYSKGIWREIGSMSTRDTLLGLNLADLPITSLVRKKLTQKITVYNIEVDKYHNYFAGGILAHNKLAFGGATATTPETTRFVGSLYDETATRQTSFIYVGDTRVAGLNNGILSFYHSNHLGSTNLITDGGGVLKELLEYKPFGEFAKNEKYGTPEQRAWHQFTGQRLDDETGLYYYGARYYDPSLGRFITPDSIVQSPGGNPQTFNRYSYAGNNPVNNIDPTGHSWFKKFWKAAVTAIVGTVLIIASAGTLAPVVGTYWAGVATGAMVGATIGGTFAAATGGNIGMGLLTGAVGGAVFAGLAPGLSTFSDGIFRGISLGGAAGPLTPGVSMASNFTAGFLGGAASGAAVAGINGADVGQGALIGGAFAGGFSAIRDTALWMRAKMVQQSRLDPRNASGKSVGFNNDGFKLGGGRVDPAHPNGNPSPLGGHQGGQGQIFGMPYQPGSVFDRIVEGYAGPHDFLNSRGYDAFGNLQNHVGFERVLGGTLNPLNVVIATPIAVPSAFPRVTYPGPGIVYGLQKPSSGDK